VSLAALLPFLVSLTYASPVHVCPVCETCLVVAQPRAVVCQMFESRTKPKISAMEVRRCHS